MKLKKVSTLALLVAFWIAFVFAWGIWYWKDAVLFSSVWWFDTVGHVVFGFFGAFTLLYLFRTYAAKGAFVFVGRTFLSILIVAIIAITGVFWEVLELWWDYHLQPDYFDWLAKAQKNSADTTIDILVDTIAAALAMLMYGLYSRLYERYFPDGYAKDEIEEMRIKIEHFSKEIHSKRKEHFRQIKPTLRKLARNIREKMRKI